MLVFAEIYDVMSKRGLYVLPG